MEPRKPAAERIRPILEAMERSIDSARRKRTLSDEPRPRHTHPVESRRNDPVTDNPVNPIASISKPSGDPPNDSVDDRLRTETGERLKARPKRPQNFYPPHAQPLPPYHSRAS